MRVLVLGGSAFLGRVAVSEALAAGHDVSTFNRGRSGPDLAGAEAIRGDRTSDADLAVLGERRWDVVVDTSGYVPEVVGRSARLLAPLAGAYVFVSTINAYPGFPAEPGITETSATHDCPPDAGEEDGDYGFLKVGCERAAREAFGDRALVVRSGLLFGPHDNTNRLPWWLTRIATGGRVLAPGDRDRPMQLIDARDQARWFLDAARRGVSGVYNAAGPGPNTTMGDLLDTGVAVTGSGAELTWFDDDTLLAHEVRPWDELPLWAPDKPEFAGVWEVDSSAARATGLRCRPVSETVRDTWEWLRTGVTRVPRTHADLPQAGMDPGKEQRILASSAT